MTGTETGTRTRRRVTSKVRSGKEDDDTKEAGGNDKDGIDTCTAIGNDSCLRSSPTRTPDHPLTVNIDSVRSMDVGPDSNSVAILQARTRKSGLGTHLPITETDCAARTDNNSDSDSEYHDVNKPFTHCTHLIGESEYMAMKSSSTSSPQEARKGRRYSPRSIDRIKTCDNGQVPRTINLRLCAKSLADPAGW